MESTEDQRIRVGGKIKEVTEGGVKLEGWEVFMDPETVGSIAEGRFHGDHEVGSGASTRAEYAQTTVSEADLADEDRALRGRWEAEEGGEKIINETVGRSREWACPFLPRGVIVIEREVVKNVRGE